jgi:hypothetical protein
VSAPFAIGAGRPIPALRVTLPQRSPPPAGTPALQVLRSPRVPQQLSLFERPAFGR